MTWHLDPLQRLLTPHDVGDFLAQTWGQSPRLLAGDPDKFGTLFGWEALSALLNRDHAASAKLRLIEDQVNYVYTKGPDTLRAVLRQLRAGATLVLENIDRHVSALALLLDALSDQLGLPAHVNLYLSAPGRQGYPLHYDNHDFLILQISGSKRWEIFPQTPEALGGDSLRATALPPPEDQRLHDWLLTPGDVLYLPRGHWHRALAEDTHSLHLTLGFYPANGARLLRWLVDSLCEQGDLQRHWPLAVKTDLPRRAGAASPYQAELAALQQTLQSALQDPSLLQRFHQETYLALERRLAFALPHQLVQRSAELAEVAVFDVRQVPRYLSLNAQGEAELVFPRHRLCWEAAAEPLLREVLSQSQIEMDALCARFPDWTRETLLGWLLPLVQQGLLVPRCS